MNQELQYDIQNKWFIGISAAVLFACLILYTLTGSLIYIGAPFAYIFLLLLGIHWKTAYWVMLFCIPASVQISFAGDTLSACLPDEPMMWLFFLLFMLVWAKNPAIIPKWWWRNPLVLIVTLQFVWLIVAVIFSLEFFFSVKFLIAKSWYLVCFFIIPIWTFTEKKDFKRAFILMLIPIIVYAVIILVRHAHRHFDFRATEEAIRIGGDWRRYCRYRNSNSSRQ